MNDGMPPAAHAREHTATENDIDAAPDERDVKAAALGASRSRFSSNTIEMPPR